MVLCTKELYFVAETDVRKINYVACDFSSIKIHYSVNRINEIYVFSIKNRYRDFLLKNLKLYL